MLQAGLFHGVAVVGIVLAIAGQPNIFAAPEYSAPEPYTQWHHIAAHLTVGMLAVSLIGWGAMSLVMRLASGPLPPRS